MRRLSGFALSVGLGVALLVGVSPQAASAQQPIVGAGFQPVTPVRVLDTRTTGTPVGPEKTITLNLAGRVPASATAVVLNITGTQPSAATWVTVYPNGVNRPLASNLNLAPGENRPNLVTISLGAGQKVDLYNQAGTVHLIADLTGYYAPAAPGKFTALDASKLFEFRAGPNSVTTVDLAGRVPASATAVTFNLKGGNASAGTYVAATPADNSPPTTSNLNIEPGQTSSNLVIVAVGSGLRINIHNRAGEIDLRGDIAGFYTPDYGSVFTAVTPERLLDTRDGTGGVTGPIDHGRGFTAYLGGRLFTTTTSAVLNLTGTSPTAATDVTIWSNLPPNRRPVGSSNLNLAAGQTAPNLTTVAVGGWGSINGFNSAGSVHLVIDLAGIFHLPQDPCGAECLLAWGSNAGGILGTGVYHPGSNNPTPVYRLPNVKAVADGTALRGDGTVWAWGPNGQGQLGNGWQGGYSRTPVQVLGLTDVKAIDRGIALRKDGTVWAWGSVPGKEGPDASQVSGLSNIIAVAAAGQTAFAVRDDGTVWAWGSNSRGALGIGAPEGHFTTVPTQVPGLTGVRTVVATGLGALALKDDGTVWTWGTNANGQLGTGTVGQNCESVPPTGPNCYSNVPVQVTTITGATAIAADSLRGFAVRNDGTAWGWGSNHYGALGNGVDCTHCSTGTPSQVVGLTNARSIKAYGSGGYALDADGRVWAWGEEIGPVESRPPTYYSTVALRQKDHGRVHAIGASPSGAGFALIS